jgi:hypothetical protein
MGEKNSQQRSLFRTRTNLAANPVERTLKSNTVQLSGKCGHLAFLIVAEMASALASPHRKL